MVCLGSDVGEVDFPVVSATSSDYHSSEFWRSLRLDIAIVWNWLRGSHAIRAITDAGIKVVLRGDTDGLVSKRVFPLQSFQRFVDSGVGLRSRLGLAKHFVFHAFPHARYEDEELLLTLRAADAVAVETPIAREGILTTLQHYGETDLAQKLCVVPHSVRDAFVSVAVNPRAERKRQVVAAGRWDSTQKNPELLVKTVERIVKQDRLVSVVICGAASDATISALARLGERVCYAGRVSVDAMIGYLNESEVFLSTSRWETHPIGSLEAVCMGCSVVAPPIRGFRDLLADPLHGRIARSGKPRSLADTVIEELNTWDRNERQIVMVANQCRLDFCNRTVINSLMRSVEPA